jgi:hypothetical protein
MDHVRKLHVSWHLCNIQKTRDMHPMNSFIVHEAPERWLRDHRIASIPWFDRICIRYSSPGKPMVHVVSGALAGINSH